MTTRRRIITALVMFLIGAGICLLYLYFEAQTRILLTLRYQETHNDADTLWIENYGPSGYFSLPFLKESFEVADVLNVSSNGYVIEKDFHGQYIHVIDHKRATAFQPEHANHMLYMLGDSTLFSSNVPDEYTIASLLQWWLNHTAGPSYKVVNMGIPAMNAAKALALLKTLPLHQGDQVIFYTALSDAQGVYEDAQRHRGEEFPQQVCLWARSHFTHVSFSEAYCKWTEATYPPEIDGSQFWQDKIADITAKYESDLTDAAQYARSAGATFHAILPPHLWSKPQLSDFETRIMRNTILMAYGKEQVFSRFWPSLEATHDRLLSRGFHTYNLSHVLDNLRTHKQQKFFFDCCHLNPAGNAIVADAIYNLIAPF